MVRGRQKLNISTLEAFCFLNYGAGQSFLTHKQDKDIQAFSTHYKRKIKTERFVGIDSNKHKTIIQFTKVTLLDDII